MSHKSVKKFSGKNVPNNQASTLRASESASKSNQSRESKPALSKLLKPAIKSSLDVKAPIKVSKEGDNEPIFNNKLLHTKNSIEELRRDKLKNKSSLVCTSDSRPSCSSSKTGPDGSDFEELTDDNYYNTYNFAPKKTKSIRFINEVRVFEFSGPDTLCESCEPLKKEIEQQFRNKEMRKIKGQESIYLF